ncbi:MAG: 2-C-methyl-D-erythritol 2,4-cyclodiphosphate synthase [Planctomycetota bacterium]|nr:MAG: 2-C-methyl-D-erythritol 2,4-cyclodiphosphate synthase [Planctomycetota bacterium]
MNDIPSIIPRVGLGTDLHRMVPGRPCRLGGLSFDCPVGPFGHSDGDAILHALTDALLGAAGLPDLGTQFPNDDPQWKDAPSERFVRAASEAIAAEGLAIWSVDCVVHCDRPRIGPRREELRRHLGQVLGLDPSRINIKGKSLEGCAGEHETVSAMVVALLGPSPKLSPEQ